MSAEGTSRATRRTAGVIAVLLLAALVGGRPATADTKSELDSAKAKLSDLRDDMEATAARVHSLENEASQIAASLDRVQSEIAETQAEIARLQGEIEKANEELAKLQDQLDRRAWIAYESGPGTSFEFVLGSTSLADLSTRLEIVNRAAQSDRDLIDRVQDQRALLQTKRLQQERARTKLQGQLAEFQQQQRAVEAKLHEANTVAAQLNTQEAKYQKLVSQLHDKYQRELEAKRLAELQQQQQQQRIAPPGSGGGGTVVGHPFQVCPVRGPVGYSDDFGAPRYGGGYHLHAGNDMFAAKGTPVVAPFSGTASDATNGLGGLAVKVFGPAGWVYNAHLDTIERLGSVSAGDLIGTVGNTGDAQGTPYHDHFEWHPYAIPASPWTSPYGVSQVGDAIDPYPYLNQVC